MNNFKSRIRMLTQKQKEKIYKDVIFIMMNSTKIFTQEELVKRMSRLSMINEYEVRAIYNLALYIKKSILVSSNEKELFEFLNLSEYCRNDNGNLLKFVNETVQDIKEWEKYMNGEWNFHLGLIFKRLKGHKPYEDYKNGKKETPAAPNPAKVVKYKDWFEI